ncbi:hypothetical protein KSP40_PGU010939 [Platanthera guangdongensis]|uniref:Uncharacterized protein n=1 Tax=Platanthera guangdongensis TaxID=2320717 RepID=A0ABR2N1P3_9ASPA
MTKIAVVSNSSIVLGLIVAVGGCIHSVIARRTRTSSSAIMTRLSMEQITLQNENRDVGSVTSLQLSYRALSDVSHMFSHIRRRLCSRPGGVLRLFYFFGLFSFWITLLVKVSCLSNYQNLEKLDLSYNCLTSLEGLSVCVNLKWLQVFENKLATLKGVESLSKLTVLNAGRNKLEKMDEIYGLKNLRALILNDNNISSICKLGQMKYLNTLGFFFLVPVRDHRLRSLPPPCARSIVAQKSIDVKIIDCMGFFLFLVQNSYRRSTTAH